MAQSGHPQKSLKSNSMLLHASTSTRILAAGSRFAIANPVYDDVPTLLINDRGPFVHCQGATSARPPLPQLDGQVGVRYRG
jgi:hypothetical protein